MATDVEWLLPSRCASAPESLRKDIDLEGLLEGGVSSGEVIGRETLDSNKGDRWTGDFSLDSESDTETFSGRVGKGAASSWAQKKKATEQAKHVATTRPNNQTTEKLVPRRASAPALKIQDARQSRAALRSPAAPRSPAPPQGSFRSSADLGSEWMVRLQANDHIRTRKQACCRQLLQACECALPQVASLDTHIRSKLIERMSTDIERMLVALSKQAFDEVKDALVEAETMKAEASEIESKVTQMNLTHMKEITQLRDRHRVTCENVLDQVEASSGDSYILFYEPMQYMSAENRQHVLAIVEEKLKQIFSRDPSLRDRADKSQLAHFEETVLREKVAALETANRKQRDELTNLRPKLRKAEEASEKASFQMAELEIKSKQSEANLRIEISELQVKLQSAQQCYDMVMSDKKQVENRCGELEDLLAHAKATSEEKSCELQDLAAKAQALEAKLACAMVGQASRINVACQTDRCRRDRNSFGSNLGNWGLPRIEAAVQTSMEVELNTEHEGQTCSESGRQRESSETTVQSRPELLARIADLRSQHDLMTTECERIRSQLALMTTERNQSQSSAKAQSEHIVAIESQLQKAQQDVQMSNSISRGLRLELEETKELLAQAEIKRVQDTKAQATDLPSENLARDLEKHINQKHLLVQELNQAKSSLSVALSKNTALELQIQVLRRGQEEPERKFGSIVKERQQLDALAEQRSQLRDKVTVTKAQLEEVLSDNQVLTLTLEEMQREMHDLTRQLRNVMPKAVAVPPDLETVLSRMDKVVKDGGGRYLRLHKDAKLREVAAAVLSKNNGDANLNYVGAAPLTQECVTAAEKVDNGAVPNANPQPPSTPPCDGSMLTPGIPRHTTPRSGQDRKPMMLRESSMRATESQKSGTSGAQGPVGLETLHTPVAAAQLRTAQGGSNLPETFNNARLFSADSTSFHDVTASGATIGDVPEKVTARRPRQLVGTTGTSPRFSAAAGLGQTSGVWSARVAPRESRQSKPLPPVQVLASKPVEHNGSLAVGSAGGMVLLGGGGSMRSSPRM